MDNAVAMKNYKVISEFIWEDSDNFSLRFFQIIQAALKRIEAARAFFYVCTQNAADTHRKAFFQQLECKKDIHSRIIEKIGRNSELLPFPINVDMGETKNAARQYDDYFVSQAAESVTPIQNVFEFVYEKALDELDFYLNFLLIEKHPVITSLLLSLANLSKDFLFEAKLRYLELQSRIEMENPEKIVEYFMSLERRSN